jgi:rod shape-determining protein MreD
MAQTLADTLHATIRPRINRAPSPVLAVSTPWLLVMFGSLTPLLPLIASAPVLPPFGFLVLVAWQQLRPGLFPVWAGVPLGLFDDLFSGQPFGSAVLLWSIMMIALDLIETRFPWRGFASNWLVAAAAIVAYLLAALEIAHHGAAAPTLLLPQLLIAVLSYPLTARLVGQIDRLRLVRVRSV